MRLLLVIILMFCSDVRCYLETPPRPIPSPVVTPTMQPVQLGQGFPVIGSPWNDLSDGGYCGIGMPSGSGSPPNLSWPLTPNLNENRGFRQTHPAIDLYANEGDSVLAAAGGSVVWAGESSFGGGNVVAISHGSFYTAYFHLSEVLVSCGEWVGSGSLIGLVGSTGAVSTGYYHLHFFLVNGIMAYDPIPYLP